MCLPHIVTATQESLLLDPPSLPEESEMANVVPFSFENSTVRVVHLDGEAWFVGKDVAERLGYADPTSAMKQHCKGVVKRHPLQTAGGLQEVRILSEPDVLRLIVGSKLPAAERFERWIFEEVLPSIRKTGSYSAQAPKPARPKAPTLPANVRAMLLIGDYIRKVPGVDPALAAACTMDAIEKMTGIPARSMTRALPATSVDNAATLNATDLGKRFGISAKAMNAELARLGLQTKTADGWDLTEKGTAYAERKPFHRNGHSGYETRWRAGVLDLLPNNLSPALNI
jgi:prophage antirepressor-like protein